MCGLAASESLVLPSIYDHVFLPRTHTSYTRTHTRVYYFSLGTHLFAFISCVNCVVFSSRTSTRENVLKLYTDRFTVDWNGHQCDCVTFFSAMKKELKFQLSTALTFGFILEHFFFFTSNLMQTPSAPVKPVCDSESTALSLSLSLSRPPRWTT